MSRALMAYFSASGVTRGVAETLAGALKANVYEIRPKEPYTEKDLDWTDKASRSSVEMHDPASRPALADFDAPIGRYDVIYLGFPIWWYTAPHIVHTFLESYDFSGKTIVVFATSGGSDFGSTIKALTPSAGKAKLVEGRVFTTNATKESIAAWVKGLKL